MSTVTIDIERPIEQVWSGVVDADGYPDWLVGAQNVDVPDLWPECGESFHHRVGFGPFQMPGSTTSVDVAEPSFFHIRAGVGPFGEADVTFELESISPDTTRVTMTEKPTDGVIDVIGRLAGPLVERTIRVRNAKSLAQFRHLLEGSPRSPADCARSLGSAR